jgi:hypothetical protein
VDSWLSGAESLFVVSGDGGGGNALSIAIVLDDGDSGEAFECSMRSVGWLLLLELAMIRKSFCSFLCQVKPVAKMTVSCEIRELEEAFYIYAGVPGVSISKPYSPGPRPGQKNVHGSRCGVLQLHV